MLRAYSSYGRENLDSRSPHRCKEICKSDFWFSFPGKSYRGSKMLTKSSQIPIGSTIGNHRLPELILRGFFDISRLSRPRHRPHMFSRPEIEWETLLDNSRSDRSNLKRSNPRLKAKNRPKSNLVPLGRMGRKSFGLWLKHSNPRIKAQNQPKSDLVPTSFSKYYPTTLVDTVGKDHLNSRNPMARGKPWWSN